MVEDGSFINSEEELRNEKVEALKLAAITLQRVREGLDCGKNQPVFEAVLSKLAGLLEHADLEDLDLYFEPKAAFRLQNADGSVDSVFVTEDRIEWDKIRDIGACPCRYGGCRGSYHDYHLSFEASRHAEPSNNVGKLFDLEFDGTSFVHVEERILGGTEFFASIWHTQRNWLIDRNGIKFSIDDLIPFSIGVLPITDDVEIEECEIKDAPLSDFLPERFVIE